MSNGYKISVNADKIFWSPCCYYSKRIPLLNPLEFQKELKYTSTAKGWLPECQQCRQMEDSGAAGLAPRLRSFDRMPDELADGACGALEINLDLACNAACLSCGWYSSTTWQKYEIKHGLRTIPVINKKDQHLKNLIAAVPLDSLRDLFILGGEPFYSDSHLTLLRHLEQTHPDLSKVTLRYQTNASIIPDEETIAIWSKFKTVTFAMSIDGIGERFNYLRWPLKWHRVERTVDYIIKNTNAILGINATVNPLNALYVDEIEQWAEETIPESRKVARIGGLVRLNRCTPPLDLSVSSTSLRQAVVEKYSAEHGLSKIFSNLELNNHHRPMFDYIEQHDRIRRLDWRRTFPDLGKHYPDLRT